MNINQLTNYNDRTSYKEDQETIVKSLKTLSKDYHLRRLQNVELNTIQRQLSLFDSLKGYNSVVISDGFEISKDNRSSTFINLVINSTIKRYTSNQIYYEKITEYEFVGLIKLKKDYKHTIIRPETIEDKINELKESIEIDFPQSKKFSRRYYVLSDDKTNLETQSNKELLDNIGERKDYHIETRNNLMLIRLRKKISLENAKVIANILYAINNGEN